MAFQKTRSSGTGKAGMNSGRWQKRAAAKTAAKKVRRVEDREELQPEDDRDPGDVPVEMIGLWYFNPDKPRELLQIRDFRHGKVLLDDGKLHPWKKAAITFDELMTKWVKARDCKQCSTPTHHSDGFCSDCCESVYDEAFCCAACKATYEDADED